MSKKKILIDAVFKRETRAVLINSETNYIEEIEYQTANKHQIKANIYLAKVIRIERSLQAAFIDYGSGKNGFLPFSEIHPDYFNVKDVSKLTQLKPITPLELNSLNSKEEESKISLNVEASDYLSDRTDISIEVDEFEVDRLDSEASNNADSPLKEQPKLEDVLRKGQILLVQAQKEERGNKGASFTTYISLAGKYCVLMPNKGDQNGISRRISNFDERKRLKNLIAQFNANQQEASSSVIVRTAGVGRTSYEIKRDYDYLVRLWNRIREVTLQSVAPAFIHMEEDIIQKIIRDLFDHNVDEILIEGGDAFISAAEFIKNILPLDSHKVKEYVNKVPIFTKYGIEEQLSHMYQPIANLPSGGYIVINPTEALISVDVNSGKSTSEKNIEETAVKTNIEAAKEIARQAKLRDLSGLLVIDFIDMADIKNKRLVERTLKDCFSRDKARIQIGSISLFGLIEMSRQRLRPSFTESNSIICSNCNGKGIVRADESNAMLILRTIENEVFKGEYDKVNVFTTMPSILYILNNKRHEITQIEEKYNIKLGFFHDHKATSDSFSIEKVKLTNASSLSSKSALVSNLDLYADAEEAQPRKVKWKAPQEEKINSEKILEKISENLVDQVVPNVQAIETTENKAVSKEPNPKNNGPFNQNRNRNRNNNKSNNPNNAQTNAQKPEIIAQEVTTQAIIAPEIVAQDVKVEAVKEAKVDLKEVNTEQPVKIEPIEQENKVTSNLPLSAHPINNKALLSSSILEGMGAIDLSQAEPTPDLLVKSHNKRRIQKRRRFQRTSDSKRNSNSDEEGSSTEPKSVEANHPQKENSDKITS
jgi:ribonuclease E